MTARRELDFAPLAISDIEDAAEYLGRDDPRVARRFIADLRLKCLVIAEFPQAWPIRRGIGNSVRVATHGQYLVLYNDAPASRTVRIARVLHGSRDIMSILDRL